MQIKKLNPEVEQVLIGSMCGDGGLFIQKTCRNACFNEVHHIRQKLYVLSKLKILEQQFKMYKWEYIYKKIGKVVLIRSCARPILTKYHKLFYSSNKRHKVMPYKILEKLGPLGLAIWYQDDGCYRKSVGGCSIAIHKQNINVIKRFFLNKLDIIVTAWSSKYNNKAEIYIRKKDTNTFFNIIKPYIHSSMKYKIEITKEEEAQILKNNRKNYKTYYYRYIDECRLRAKLYHKNKVKNMK